MYIILLGAPGAGKGTQAVMLAEKTGLVQVATGDLFRQALEQGTELGHKAKAYMEKGALVPDEITIEIVMERLKEPDCIDGTILDGFPRNIEQAKTLDKALTRLAKAVNIVIYIKVSKEELIRRLGGRWICRKCQAPYHEINSPPRVAGKCDRCGGELYQRPDDTPETVAKRLDVYFKETAPLIDYYTQADKLIEVDGVGDTSDVAGRILRAIQSTESASR